MRLWKPFVMVAVIAAVSLEAQAPAAAPAPPPKNLQVLPKEIPREQLIETMRRVSFALGVRCNHCHVVTATEPKEEFDFPSDAKETKKIARLMMRMTGEINRNWLPQIDEAAGMESGHAENPAQVSCWTCHRGNTEPDEPPPLPEPGQRQRKGKE